MTTGESIRSSHHRDRFDRESNSLQIYPITCTIFIVVYPVDSVACRFTIFPALPATSRGDAVITRSTKRAQRKEFDFVQPKEFESIERQTVLMHLNLDRVLNCMVHLFMMYLWHRTDSCSRLFHLFNSCSDCADCFYP